MLRALGLVALAAIATTASTPSEPARPAAPPLDVAALLAAARGTAPVICSLASQSIRNFGWSDASDIPASPIGPQSIVPERGDDALRLDRADQDRLLEALASDDRCVRELSVRLLGRHRDAYVAEKLVAKLSAPDAPLRAVAALGLGLSRAPESAVDPLVRTLRDASPDVRANSAWALGRLRHGRALAPIVEAFKDDSPLVREAAVAAAGRFDSTSVVAALVRVLQQDPSPAVRRVAAWALGQREARGDSDASAALAAVLARDSDARVREMAAWAIGNGHRRSGSAALLRALAQDESDAVRETAAWALGEAGDRAAVETLSNAAASDRSARVRGTAAWALGNMRGESGRAPAGLLKVLRDGDDDVRLKAAWALGQIGDASTVGDVTTALRQEQSAEVRRALIRALSRSGQRTEVMTELLSSSDARVREAAVRGLAGQNAFDPWPWPWPRPRPFP